MKDNVKDRIKIKLQRIRDKISKKNSKLKYVYNDSVLDAIATVLVTFQKFPNSVRRIIKKLLLSISKKLVRRQDISQDVKILHLLDNAVSKMVAYTAKFTLPASVITLVIKVAKIKPQTDTPAAKVLFVWKLFVNFLTAIQIASAVLTIHDLRTIASDINEIANSL